MTQKNNTPGAAARNSFIETFAFGDKSEAIRSLIAEADSSRRFDGITSDDFIYEALSAGYPAQVLQKSSTQAIPA